MARDRVRVLRDRGQRQRRRARQSCVVNYADGVLPLDKWFGSFHDGTPDGDAAMKRRRLARAGRPTADVNG